MYKSNLGFSGFIISSILCLLIVVSPVSAEINPESIVQILQRLETIENKSRELTGENEVLKNEIEQLKKVQKQGFLNVDEQIDEIRQKSKDPEPEIKKTIPEPEAAKTVIDDTKSVVVASSQPTTLASKVETPPEIKEVKTDGVKTIPNTVTENIPENGNTREPSTYEKETYQVAFNKMSASPSAATQAFKEYIKLQPDSPLAANAQYWIGEIMYSHNNYKGAVDEFIKVLQQYKGSNKAPDAAIKLGYSFYALKNWPYARRTFEDVLKYFPDNKNAISLATKRLEIMKAAGN